MASILGSPNAWLAHFRILSLISDLVIFAFFISFSADSVILTNAMSCLNVACRSRGDMAAMCLSMAMGTSGMLSFFLFP